MYKGIDLSYHNGRIDLSGLKNAGYNYVILRAGYGKNNIDKLFEYYASACEAYDIPFGIYWFSYALNEDMARKEAKYAIDAIKKYKTKCIIAYDLEYDSVEYANKNGVTIDKSLATNMAEVFCKEVTSAGYIPVLYTNKDYKKNYFNTDKIDAYLWYARYTSSLTTDEKNSCAIWQKSSTDTIPGIIDKVDVNEFYIDFESIGIGSDTQVNKPNSGNENLLNFQNAANYDGYLDKNGKPLVPDGLYGSKSESVVNSIVLKNGSSGVLVDWTQKRLNEEMDAGLVEDGEYGIKTEASVKDWQNMHGLVPDGYCGPKTIRTLL